VGVKRDAQCHRKSDTLIVPGHSREDIAKIDKPYHGRISRTCVPQLPIISADHRSKLSPPARPLRESKACASPSRK